LASVDASERKQMEALLNEIKNLSESNEKMTRQISSSESDLKTKNKNI
jgi:septal ring factor EnvC (AmiA/AmiB activator)